MNIKCNSGLNGWREKLQTNYHTFEDFKSFSDTYGLAKRLGFESAEKAWEANPLIEGSTDPDDFRIAPIGADAKPRFKVVTDIDTEKKWISQALNKGDFDFAFVIALMPVRAHVGEREAAEIGAKFWVTLHVVSPDRYSEKEAALKSMSEDRKWAELSWTEKVLFIHEYAGGAQLLTDKGNNEAKLVKLARDKAVQSMAFTFGFDMDKAQNKIGSTGWDFVRGDILAGLNKGEDTPEKQIMKKMQAAGPTLGEYLKDGGEEWRSKQSSDTPPKS